MPEPDLQYLKRSRVLPAAGDVFTFMLSDRLYRFGRVIELDIQFYPFENIMLAFVYEGGHATKSIDCLKFAPPRLQIPPLLITPHGWRQGYFETIGNVTLTQEEVFPSYRFRDFTGDLFDQYGNTVSDSGVETGIWGMSFPEMLAVQVSYSLEKQSSTD